MWWCSNSAYLAARHLIGAKKTFQLHHTTTYSIRQNGLVLSCFRPDAFFPFKQFLMSFDECINTSLPNTAKTQTLCYCNMWMNFPWGFILSHLILSTYVKVKLTQESDFCFTIEKKWWLKELLHQLLSDELKLIQNFTRCFFFSVLSVIYHNKNLVI